MKISTLNRSLSVIVLALMAAAGIADAYAALLIYKVKGNVTVKNNSKTVKAVRRAEVTPKDLLNIPKGGAVDILDSGTHRIYSSLSSGKMTVKALMDKADAQASDITGNINKKVMAAVADNSFQKRSGYDAMGMVIHETDAIAHPPLVVPEGTSYLAYLLSNATDPDSTHQDYITLKKLACDDAGEAFCFALENHLHEPLYFNIISKPDDSGISLLFPKNPVAAPKTETAAAEYIFVPAEDIRGYVVIASDKDFSIDDVKRLIEPGYDPDEDYYLSVLTVETPRKAE